MDHRFTEALLQLDFTPDFVVYLPLLIFSLYLPVFMTDTVRFLLGSLPLDNKVCRCPPTSPIRDNIIFVQANAGELHL